MPEQHGYGYLVPIIAGASAIGGLLITGLTGLWIHWPFVFAAWGMIYFVVNQPAPDDKPKKRKR